MMAKTKTTKRTSEAKALAVLPHLIAAAQAQVQLFQAIRRIETEMGIDGDGLDEYVAGLAVGLDSIEQAGEAVTVEIATDMLEACFPKDGE